MITREVAGTILTHAGPEIGVASTKAFTGQLTALMLVAMYLGQARGTLRLIEPFVLGAPLNHEAYPKQTIVPSLALAGVFSDIISYQILANFFITCPPLQDGPDLKF